MQQTIFKGCHYAFPGEIPGIKCIKPVKTEEFQFANGDSCLVIFDSSCAYDLGDTQSSINKLMGYSIGYHLNNSVRIGWRYSAKHKKIEVLLYEYVKGIRLQPSTHLCYLNLNKSYQITMKTSYNISGSKTRILIDGGASSKALVNRDFVNLFQIKKTVISYDLGLYFGGKKRAPHKIIVYKNKIRINA